MKHVPAHLHWDEPAGVTEADVHLMYSQESPMIYWEVEKEKSNYTVVSII